jgi:hypothetical protein
MHPTMMMELASEVVRERQYERQTFRSRPRTIVSRSQPSKRRLPRSMSSGREVAAADSRPAERPGRYPSRELGLPARIPGERALGAGLLSSPAAPDGSAQNASGYESAREVPVSIDAQQREQRDARRANRVGHRAGASS